MKKLTALFLLISALLSLPALAQISMPTQYPDKVRTPCLFTETAASYVGTGPTPQKMVLGGTLWRMQTNTGNVTGSATLVGLTLPAKTFNATSGFRALKIRVQGQTAANGNTKTLNILFGGTSVVVLNAASNNQTIFAEATIRRTGTNTQQISLQGYANNALLNTGSTTAAVTETSTAVLQVQMPAATANNDIILNEVTVTGESG